ncbi:hypothetical protein C8R43DRAFT_1041004 [Mycena crocata]|nr:hypothetical protein C8R43DRAFT_1041004 [Mycena crocata]
MDSTTSKDTASAPPAFVPQAPFRDPGADVILRSSDGVDFHVYRIVLSLISPVFQHMFTSPQPDSESSVPVVLVAEGGILLDRMLRFCYPGAEPVVDSLGQLCEILEVLIFKYDVQAVIPFGKQYLRGYIESEPLGAFPVAARHGWQDLAHVAAKACLRLPLRDSVYEITDEWKYVSGTVHHSLLQYHLRCGEAARCAGKDLSWVDSKHRIFFVALSLTASGSKAPTARYFDCTCSRHLNYMHGGIPGSYGYQTWLRELFQGMGELLALIPSSIEVDDCALISRALKEAQKCPSCSKEMHEILPRFISEEWWPHIKSEIAKVQLTL